MLKPIFVSYKRAKNKVDLMKQQPPFVKPVGSKLFGVQCFHPLQKNMFQQFSVSKQVDSEAMKESLNKATTTGTDKFKFNELRNSVEKANPDQGKQEITKEEHKGSNSCLDGVTFLAKKNRKGRFFVTSKKNSFGGFAIETLMIDSGSNTHLLPLQKGDLDKLAKLFPNSQFVWNIKLSRAVHGLFLALVIKAKGKTPIPVIIDEDIFKAKFSVPYLRFHLCSEDREILLSDVVLNANNEPFLSQTAKQELLKVAPEAIFWRRKHALLGQHFLAPVCSIQYEDSFLLIGERFPSQNLKFWDQLEDINTFVTNLNPTLLPSHFNDLEDEDHDGDDECYTSNSPDEFIDE